MGVPSFFKWLLKRYPKTVDDAMEEKKEDEMIDNGTSSSDDFTPPPPVGSNPVVDNLYLDMNGIIHNSAHPEEGGSYTESEMFDRIWSYIVRVVGIVRPRRCIYMAIDGVAPRAKLNQQRSRRFRSAREAQQKKEVRQRLATEWRGRGLKLPEGFEESLTKEEWDSNVITPGTPFMAKVSESLHRNIERMIGNEWKHLTIILSDATVPGEGEHKIMNWIRAQRSEVGYDPNTKHALYGMDADLIMLGLATHERYFYIFRESLGDTTSIAHVKCGVCGDRGHYSDQCVGAKWKADEDAKKRNNSDSEPSSSPPPPPEPQLIPETKASVVAFQFIYLPVLREYLTRELQLSQDVLASTSFVPSFECMLDDFLLLCMFVGNDFLPHLPSLEIREGALEMLLKVYKDLLPKILGGYLSVNGIVDLKRLGMLLKEVGKKENEIFQKRKSKEDHMRRKDREHKERILKIRNENAKRERVENKMGVRVYEEPVTTASSSASSSTSHASIVALSPPVPGNLPLPPPPPQPIIPRTSGFIHPSRQVSEPTPTQMNNTNATGSVNQRGTVPPPNTPATPAATTPTAPATPATTANTPVPAPKANLSAAALLRQKLKGGSKPASESTSAPAPAAPTVVVDPPSVVGSGVLDMSDISPVPTSSPNFGRQQSDPIPHATEAMSSLSTNHKSESLLGKRKDPEPKSATMASSSSTSDPSGSVDMDTGSSTVAFVTPLIASSASPPLELPLKKSKLHDESKDTTGQAQSQQDTQMTSVPTTTTPASTTSPTKVYDANETDQFGNRIASQTFDTYFENQWEQLNEPKEVQDPVRFGTDGWKERYYSAKLGFDFACSKSDPISSDARTGHRLFRTYLEGLCWVMYYYFHGPPSWEWYFPFHYAPLAEDLATFLLEEGGLKHGVEWTLGQPFEPIAQLMAVLPERSNHCVPKAIRAIMTSKESSPLADFYPLDFEMDLNGKRFMWQAVALLPFIDSQRLLTELRKVDHTFTHEEQERNRIGFDYIFLHSRTELGEELFQGIYGAFERRFPSSSKASEGGLKSLRSWTNEQVRTCCKFQIRPEIACGMTGTVRPYAKASVPGIPSAIRFDSVSGVGVEPIDAVSGVYTVLEPVKPHTSTLLPDIDPWVPTLVEEDFRTLVPPREFRPFVPRGQQRGGTRSNNNNNSNSSNPSGSPPAVTAVTSGQLGYYIDPNAPPHLAGHALNPNFYPPQQSHVMVYAAPPTQATATATNAPPQQQPPYPPNMPPPYGYYPPMPPPAHPAMQPGYYPPQPYMHAPPVGYPPFPGGYPPMMPPPPLHTPGVQAFLAAPPPPGKPPGWIPPPMTGPFQPSASK